MKKREKTKKCYVKTSQLKRNALKKGREAVKERVRRSRAQKKALIEKIHEENKSCATVDTDRKFSPMMVSQQFPKGGEASRKRKSVVMTDCIKKKNSSLVGSVIR